MTTELLTLDEASQRTRLSNLTLRRYIKRGILPAIKLQPSRRLLVREEDVNRLLGL